MARSVAVVLTVCGGLMFVCGLVLLVLQLTGGGDVVGLVSSIVVAGCGGGLVLTVWWTRSGRKWPPA